MLFKFRCHIQEVLLELCLGPRFSSISPLSEIKRLNNQVANYIFMIATKKDKA